MVPEAACKPLAAVIVSARLACKVKLALANSAPPFKVKRPVLAPRFVSAPTESTPLSTVTAPEKVLSLAALSVTVAEPMSVKLAEPVSAPLMRILPAPPMEELAAKVAAPLATPPALVTELVSAPTFAP